MLIRHENTISRYFVRAVLCKEATDEISKSLGAT